MRPGSRDKYGCTLVKLVQRYLSRDESWHYHVIAAPACCICPLLLVAGLHQDILSGSTRHTMPSLSAPWGPRLSHVVYTIVQTPPGMLVTGETLLTETSAMKPVDKEAEIVMRRTLLKRCSQLLILGKTSLAGRGSKREQEERLWLVQGATSLEESRSCKYAFVFV